MQEKHTYTYKNDLKFKEEKNEADAGEVAQELRAFAVIAGDLSVVPSTHVATQNHL